MACEVQLYNLGYERRETEPQPCGKPTQWIIRPVDVRAEYQSTPRQYLDNPHKTCEEHLGDVVRILSGEFPTIFFEIRKAGMYD